MHKIENEILINKEVLENALGPLLREAEIQEVLGRKKLFELDMEKTLKRVAELSFDFLEQSFVPDELERFSHRSNWETNTKIKISDAIEILKFGVLALSKTTGSAWVESYLPGGHENDALEIYQHVFSSLKDLALQTDDSKKTAFYNSVRQLQAEFLKTIKRFRKEISGKSSPLKVSKSSFKTITSQIRAAS